MSDESNQADTNLTQSKPSGQPARDVPAQAPVRSQPVQSAPQPVEIRRVEVVEEKSNLGEWVKFGILAVIMLGTPLVIFLLIPFIFGQIVPTVLGSNLPPDTPGVIRDQVVEPETAGTPAVLPGEPETGIGGEGTPTVTPAVQEPVATEVLVHIVRSGDTLASIARQYGVTQEEIILANNIQDPNQIFVGSILIIPQPASP